MIRNLLAACLVLSLPASLSAQGVLIVDDDGGIDVDSTTISGAIAAASDGDLILVRSGTYTETLLLRAKGLSIVAEEGAQVILDGVNTFAQPGVLIEDLAPAQSVYLHGLEFGGANFFGASQIVLLRNNAGSIWIEQCDVTPGTSGVSHDGIQAIDCADVTITGCNVNTAGTGGNCESLGASTCGNGLLVTRSSVYLFDSTIQAANSSVASIFTDIFAGSGVVLEDGDFFASGSSIAGGAGVFSQCFFRLNGGGGGLIVADGSGVARLLDTVVSGGQGADSGGACGQGNAGPDTSVGVGGTLRTLPGTARSFETSSPLTEGDDIQLTYHGLPGDVVILGYRAGPGARGIYLPGLRGVVLTLGVTSPELLLQGTIDTSGTLTVTIPGAPITVSGAFDHYVSQPLFLDGVSPTIGAPSQIVILKP